MAAELSPIRPTPPDRSRRGGGRGRDLAGAEGAAHPGGPARGGAAPGRSGVGPPPNDGLFRIVSPELQPEGAGMSNQGGTILGYSLGDARIKSVSWTDNDIKITLLIYSEKQMNSISFIFHNTSKLTINMDFGVYIGMPLIFSADKKECLDSKTLVMIEFGAAPEGYISFECDKISAAIL
jgi:hypothetical protein